MSIIRRHMSFEDHFTTIPNAWVRDSRLSLRARGLLVQFMSHRENWRISVAQLVRDNPEGREAIQTAIRELRDLGYLVTQVRRTEDGKLDGQDYEIADPFEFPVLPETRTTGDPYHGRPAPKEDHLQEDQSLEDQKQELLAPDGAELEVPAPDAATESFARVWQAWPIDRSKATAVKAWAKAITKAPIEDVEGAALAWAYGAARRVEAGQFQPLPYLASWLNQERWQEAPPALDPVSPGPFDADARAMQTLTEGSQWAARMQQQAVTR